MLARRAERGAPASSVELHAKLGGMHIEPTHQLTPGLEGEHEVALYTRFCGSSLSHTWSSPSRAICGAVSGSARSGGLGSIGTWRG